VRKEIWKAALKKRLF